jgi:hypothetical protein
LFVGKAGDQTFGSERADFLGWKIDHGNDQFAD